jgi:hypothetical protein
MSFSVWLLPQPGQTMGLLLPATITSLTWQQSWHAIS